jgi:hypothetical protein
MFAHFPGQAYHFVSDQCSPAAAMQEAIKKRVAPEKQEVVKNSHQPVMASKASEKQKVKETDSNATPRSQPVLVGRKLLAVRGLNSGMVGHTHEAVDQLFGCIATSHRSFHLWINSSELV